MKYQNLTFAVAMGLYLLLSGCGGGSDGAPGFGAVSTNFPYLKSAPQVSYIQNVNDAAKYDVTITVEATGPAPLFAVGLWIFSKTDSGIFEQLDLLYMGGTTWSATTYTLLPLPAGEYYLDSIMLEDGDAFAGGLVKSGWYNAEPFLSSNRYVVDQRLTNWTTLEMPEYNFGVSSIPIVNFTLPPSSP